MESIWRAWCIFRNLQLFIALMSRRCAENSKFVGRKVQTFKVSQFRSCALYPFTRARGSQVPNCRVYEFQSLKRPSQFQTLANFQCLMIRSCRISKCSKCSQSMQFKSSREWEFKFLRIRMNLSGVNRAQLYMYIASPYRFLISTRKAGNRYAARRCFTRGCISRGLDISRYRYQ